MKRKTNSNLLHRTAQIRAVKGEESEEYRFELSFSSETEEVTRWFGVEVLGHGEGECRLEWLNTGRAPLLLDHDTSEVIGVIEEAKFEGKRGKAYVRFSKNTKAEEVRQDVIDEIRSNVSVGYRTHDMILAREEEGKEPVYRVTDWEPMEISIVSVPFDRSVGIGRSDESTEHIEKLLTKRKMPQNTDNKPTENKSVSVDASAVRSAERSRIATINTIGRQFGFETEAERAVDEGQSAESFRELALNKLADKTDTLRNASDGATSPEDVLSESEKRDLNEYSFVRAIEGHLNGRLEGLELEMHQEAHREASNHGQSVSGLGIPQKVLNNSRSLTATGGTNGSEGGTMIATGLQSPIDILRNKLLVFNMGATMMNGLVGNVDFPKWVEDETEASELGENVTATQIDPESTIFSMSPSRLAVFGQISKQLLKQTSTDVEGWLRNYLMFKMSARMDRAAIEKILALTGAGVVIGGTNGGAPTWDSLVDLETEVAIDNADIGKLGYLTNPRVQGKLKKTKLDDGSGQFVWNRGAKTLNEYNVGITNQIPSDLTKGTANSICSAMIFGNFSDLICGQWGGFDVTVDGLTGAKTGMINIVTETFYDIAVAREQSFAVMKDILTT